MGYFRGVKKGKKVRREIYGPYSFTDETGTSTYTPGKYDVTQSTKRILSEHKDLFMNWDKGRCCDTDSCNDGKGKCNGSCSR